MSYISPVRSKNSETHVGGLARQYTSSVIDSVGWVQEVVSFAELCKLGRRVAKDWGIGMRRGIATRRRKALLDGLCKWISTRINAELRM